MSSGFSSTLIPHKNGKNSCPGRGFFFISSGMELPAAGKIEIEEREDKWGSVPMYTSLVRHSGNRELFLFLELAILSQSRGHPLHIHVEGLRGTGKTTIIRAARQILPPIKRIRGCLYNCDPERPHCPEHRHLSREDIDSLGIEKSPCPSLRSRPRQDWDRGGTIDLAVQIPPGRPPSAGHHPPGPPGWSSSMKSATWPIPPVGRCFARRYGDKTGPAAD